MTKHRKIKELLGMSQASFRYDPTLGWVSNRQDGSEARAQDLIKFNESHQRSNHSDGNATRRFYERWFHGSREEYNSWKNRRLTSREGVYEDGK